MTEKCDEAFAPADEDGDHLDLAEEEGWEDVEPDVEVSRMRCLLCDLFFENSLALTSHCKKDHYLDLVGLQKTLGWTELNYFGMVKLINYIRSEAAAGKMPDISNKARFQDERYMRPVLEDDSLLYSLHDIIGEDLDEQTCGSLEAPNGSTHIGKTPDQERILELESKLQWTQQTLEATRKQLEAMRLQSRVFALRTSDPSAIGQGSRSRNTASEAYGKARLLDDNESAYFDSYSGHEIHEAMLKDTVRTDAYRDFIYENKHLFRGKTVLDVGCGTGILSMFCARAGAAKVIAVDNSDIIDCADQSVHQNGLEEIIVCYRGKIEEVKLPVTNVDIIVSEWMGYCLLYEAMLDSVIWARDTYLKPDGLMIPSHCTLRLAPLSDPEYIEEHIHHWKDVYGFDMMSMRRGIYNDVVVRDVQACSVPAHSVPFLRLNLKDVTVDELTFENKPFAFELSADTEALDGFVIWFDTFFLTAPDGQPSSDLIAEDCKREGGESIAFTTGPHGKRTHWQQGALLIDYRGQEPRGLMKGQSIEGIIGYQKGQKNNRALDINIQWQVGGSIEKKWQSWSM
ncbi:Ribosomal protein arginine N-methyltransferase rmt3 [Lecanora helva]